MHECFLSSAFLKRYKSFMVSSLDDDATETWLYVSVPDNMVDS